MARSGGREKGVLRVARTRNQYPGEYPPVASWHLIKRLAVLICYPGGTYLKMGYRYFAPMTPGGGAFTYGSDEDVRTRTQK